MLAALVPLVGGVAAAAPLTSSRAGGLALNGPAIAHPASALLNPAALGLSSHRIELYLDGTAQLQHGSIQRSPIDPATGNAGPGASRSFAAESFDTFSRPQFFFSGVVRLLDTVSFGIMVHSPATVRYALLEDSGNDQWFDAAKQSASRYQGLHFELFQLRLAIAASVKLFDKIHIGASLSPLVYNWVRYAFARDAALYGGRTRQRGEAAALDDCGGGARCNYGSDLAAQAIQLRADLLSVDFGLGIAAQVHPRVVVGLGYISRPFDIKGLDLSAEGDVWIRRSQAAVANGQRDTGGSVRRDLHGRASLLFQLPHILSAGVAWQVTDRLLLDLQLRYIILNHHDKLDVRLSGPELRESPAQPSRIVHFRGLRDAFAAQLGGRFGLTSRLQLELGAMVESRAVPRAVLSSIAIDNWKLDAFAAVRLAVGAGFSLRAGYGVVFVPPVTSDRSAFAPSARVDCVERRYNILDDTCRATAQGQGVATAAGTYSLLVQRFGLAVNYSWQ